MGYIKGQKHTPSNKEARYLRDIYKEEITHQSVRKAQDWVFVYEPWEIREDNLGLRQRVKDRKLCMVLDIYTIDNT